MAVPRRKYTNEMKLNAVHLVQNGVCQACDVADEVGNDRYILYAWPRDARNGKLSTDDPAREVTPEQAEISRLRAELARSRQACALLKNSWRTSAPSGITNGFTAGMAGLERNFTYLGE